MSVRPTSQPQGLVELLFDAKAISHVDEGDDQLLGLARIDVSAAEVLVEPGRGLARERQRVIGRTLRSGNDHAVMQDLRAT